MAKKLSSREQAAKKAGGALNYSTGKISVPVKKTATTKSTKSVAPLEGAGPLLPGQTRVANSYGGGSQLYGAGPLLPGQTRVEGSYTGGSNNSKPSSSNRVKAATPVSFSPIKRPASANNNDTISAPKPTNFFSDLMGKIGQAWLNNGLSQSAPGTFLSDKQRQDNINAGLGIETANAGTSELGLALQKGSTPDQPTGYGPNGEIYYNNFDPSSEGASLFASDFATPGTNFSRPGSETAYNQGTSPVDYGIQQRAAAAAYGSRPTPFAPPTQTNISRTPRPITGGTDISSSYAPRVTATQSPQIDYSTLLSLADTARVDESPASNGQPGTRRQFLGNGVLSNGMASNGKLDSGFDGASFGVNPMDTEENLLNQLLGINTAQAAEMPQTMESFGMTETPVSAFQQSFAQGGLSGSNPFAQSPQRIQQQLNPTNVPTAPTIRPTQQPTADVTQQYAQGATGGSPLEGYYNQAQKGLKSQEKAQKKALNELLKSIRNQYKTQQESGLSELAKSKQQDLLKLSGLFSFANQDPNSEQRIQYETRLADDNSRQQADFMAKLAAAQAQEESGARQNYQKELGSLADKRSNMQLELAKLLEDARQSQLARSSKVSTPKTGSFTQVGVNPQTGSPIYRNFTTGEQWEGTGMQDKYDPFAAWMGQQQGQSQIQYDENGRPYIEQ